MIESIKTINFQSLANLDLEFGKFTVIVGPSSSGKSALTRAMKAVASNALDSDYITRGATKAAISLRTQDHTVTIERDSGDSSVYKITQVGSEESRYSKLNRQVPAEVTKALGIIPSTKEVSSINFAGQFDTPYLLTEGASSVARILGELTNVSTIFKAVKEASRRAKNASSLLNLRKKDKQQLIADLRSFTSVTQELKVVSEAERVFAECAELQRQINEITPLLDQLDSAQESLESFVEIVSVPDLAELLDAQQALNNFKQSLQVLVTSQQQIKQANIQIRETEQKVSVLEKQLHETLVAAGSCPTCNQQIVS